MALTRCVETREMRQELRHLTSAHVTRMRLAKMQNITFNPVRISLLGMNTVMLQANFAPHLIEQFRWVFQW
ncbi:hypothetical protein A1359_11565 [Methylomonas lenta]|uniref:Uncharacterized protein n=1 Tax=Methylomonas lenta TaxID=980561 RepID=A0A177N8H2_9GAMM|nr:hypothetical protein A1359_11565 [Methylomonas lenta]